MLTVKKFERTEDNRFEMNLELEGLNGKIVNDIRTFKSKKEAYLHYLFCCKAYILKNVDQLYNFSFFWDIQFPIWLRGLSDKDPVQLSKYLIGKLQEWKPKHKELVVSDAVNKKILSIKHAILEIKKVAKHLNQQ